MCPIVRYHDGSEMSKDRLAVEQDDVCGQPIADGRLVVDLQLQIRNL
jgi:hypothetical protein